MGPIRRFLRLSRQERVLFLAAVRVLIGIRLALLFLPFRTVVRRVLGVPRQELLEPADPGTRHVVSWAVRKANEVIPGDGKCLHEALAAFVILRRTGFEPELKIGVRPSGSGDIEAHAWVEETGDIVIGGPRRQTAGYTVLPDLEQVTSGLSMR